MLLLYRIALCCFLSLVTLFAELPLEKSFDQELESIAQSNHENPLWSDDPVTNEPTVAQKTAPSPKFPFFNISLSTGYDSTYNFRGVDWLPNSGVWNISATPIVHLTKDDAIVCPFLFIFGIGQRGNAAPLNRRPYTELDIPVSYFHNFGHLLVGGGYCMYSYFNYGRNKGLAYNPGGTALQHELNLNTSYTMQIGNYSIVPSLSYYYELGITNPYKYGSINAGSSFLSPGISVAIPIYKEIISFNPNTQYNISFGYNNINSGQKLYGFNNLQLSFPITWKISNNVSLIGYCAYSYQPDIINTIYLTRSPINKFYGGFSLAFNF